MHVDLPLPAGLTCSRLRYTPVKEKATPGDANRGRDARRVALERDKDKERAKREQSVLRPAPKRSLLAPNTVVRSPNRTTSGAAQGSSATGAASVASSVRRCTWFTLA